MRVVVLSSGGKDSVYAHWWATLQGWDVISLITCKIIKDDSLMFQIPGTQIVELQSKVTNTNYIEIQLSGEEELEMIELRDFISNLMKEGEVLHGLEGIVTGALRSDYQKSRVEIMCNSLEICSFSPLWHNDSYQHMRALIDNGFKLILSSVSCDGLDESWLGKTISKENLEKLEEISKKYRFNVDGEGGEFETSVLYAPHFSSEILIEGNKIWKNDRGFFEFTSLKIDN